MPRRSANVSMLLLRTAAPGFLTGVEVADCSLCCQQKEDCGEEAGEARARRQGRPAEVMPWQVRFGSRESERARRDSGVFFTKGIVGGVLPGFCVSDLVNPGAFGLEGDL